MDSSLIDYNLIILNILLYAELHYKFKWIGSRYFQNEPEILADLPFRIEPEKKIPILLLIKDSNRFPIVLNSVLINIYQLNNKIYSESYTYNKSISQKWWNKTIFIDTKGIEGNIDIHVEFDYLINGLQKQCITHNYPQSKIDQLNTYISNYKYPNDQNTYYGDLHYHTNLRKIW